MPDIWRSFVASWTMDDGRVTEMKLYPIDLGMHKSRGQRGWPSLMDDVKALEKIQELSSQLGTTVTIKDGIGYVEF